MALRALNPPVAWSPNPVLLKGECALRQLPPRRSDRPPPLRAVRNRDGTRIAAGKGGCGGLGQGTGEGDRRGGASKSVDLATLGNLCVDIVLGVPSLPPEPADERRAYMERLAASPPDQKHWEAGGNSNLAIAAARLGLHVATLGHVGDEIYGHFLIDVLQDEGISIVGMNENAEATVHNAVYETLLCWVLVDPFQKHGFCSRADFSDGPAFSWMSKLSGQVKMVIQESKILFCNGYSFDELLPNVIISALERAIDAGTAIFFDPGPRGSGLRCGTPEEQRALHLFLRLSDVLLLTSDEAESLTGITNPIRAGQELIKKGVRTKWVIIKMGSKGSILITRSIISCAPAFKVNVVDTVGCGDSFTAAIAFGFLHGLPAVNTLALANAVGAATATGWGAGQNVAHLDKVLELLRRADLNENDKLWDELIEATLETPEVILLSKTCLYRCSGRFVCSPIHSVVSELLQKFKVEYERSIVHS